MTLTNLLLLLLSATMLFTGVTLFISIRKNYLIGQSFRKLLQEQVESLRFGEMLKKYNRDPQVLLHESQIPDIQKQIKNCHECLKTAACDVILNDKYINEQNLAFCPNNASFK